MLSPLFFSRVISQYELKIYEMEIDEANFDAMVQFNLRTNSLGICYTYEFRLGFEHRGFAKPDGDIFREMNKRYIILTNMSYRCYKLHKLSLNE